MFWNNKYAPYDLADVSTYAHGVGPNTAWLKYYKNQTNGTSSNFVSEAHSLDLAVHPYVYQDDNLQFTHNAIEEA